MSFNPAEEIEKLRKEIEHHNHLYYDLDDPVLSDTQYDQLYQKLKDLEARYPQFAAADSPTQKVGGKASTAFSPVVHRTPMMSLDNSYNAEDVRAWHERCAKTLSCPVFDMVLEAKIDGVSCSLTYTDGVLTTAASRGDGKTGEDITANVLTVKDIPHRIANAPAGILEIRGEIYLEKKDLATLTYLKTDEPILTLQEALEIVQGKVPLLINIINTSCFTDTEKLVVEHFSGYKGQYAFMSVNPITVQYLRKTCPDHFVGIKVVDFHEKKYCGFKTKKLKKAPKSPKYLGL